MNLHVHSAHRQRKSLGCEHKKRIEKRWRIKARTHRDEYRCALFASIFQCVFCVHTQAIFADDEPSEHANSFPDIRWRLM